MIRQINKLKSENEFPDKLYLCKDTTNHKNKMAMLRFKANLNKHLSFVLHLHREYIKIKKNIMLSLDIKYNTDVTTIILSYAFELELTDTIPKYNYCCNIENHMFNSYHKNPATMYALSYDKHESESQ